MRNLDKVWDIWENLDFSFSKQSKGKREFLLSLISAGDKDKVLSLLAKIANDISCAEDNKIFAAIQSSMLALINGIDQIDDKIGSIDLFIRKLKGEEKAAQSLDFDQFIELVAIGKPYNSFSADFEVSPVGMELITADSIHKVKFASNSAVMIPAWVQSIDSLGLTDSQFHKKVTDSLQSEDNLKKKKPYLFLDKNNLSTDKTLHYEGTSCFLDCGNSSIEALII